MSYFLVVWVPNGSSSLPKMKFGKLPALFGNDYLFIILLILALSGLLPLLPAALLNMLCGCLACLNALRSFTIE